MQETANKKRVRSIWSLIGYIFVIYGVLLMGTGVYYLYSPPVDVALYQLNPSLWWGAFLLVVGLVFSFVDSRRKG